jgi:hypothetical protein
MKPIQIEFEPSRTISIVWGCVLAITAGAALSTAYIVWKNESRASALRVEREAAERDHRAYIATHAPPAATKPQLAAMRLLQADLNRPFATIENMDEPGAQLVALSIDNAAGNVRLEYVLDSIPRASSVTAALNAGMPRPAWVLESVSGAGKQSSGQVPGQPSTGPRGSWLWRDPGG